MQRRWFFKRLVLFSIPLWLVLGTYFWLDPFKVVWQHDYFFADGQPCQVILNKDFVSTEMYLRNSAQRPYDSFIFGNSRSMFYPAKAWESHIENEGIFHFDASDESLFGVYTKVRYFSRKGIKIRNALLVVDALLLSKNENSEGHLFIKHPSISGHSWLKFHLASFKNFLDLKFLRAYLYFKRNGHVSDYAKQQLLMSEVIYGYDSLTNEISLPTLEDSIELHGEAYYRTKHQFFVETPDTTAHHQVLLKPHQRQLQFIAERFAEMGTEYRVIISPHFGAPTIHPKDLEMLQQVFGNGRVFDFSGPNEFSKEQRNFYDGSHYRPKVAEEIMRRVYAKS